MRTQALTSELLAFKMCRAQHAQLQISQLEFLWTIAENPGISHSELAIELGVTASALSRNVDVFGSEVCRTDRAKNYGLIESRRSPTDDRVKTLHLTAKGSNFIDLFQKLFNGDFCS